MVKATEPEYIVDSEGHKTKVILSVEAYEALLEDLHDLSVAFERKDEPLLAWEDVKRDLEDDTLQPTPYHSRFMV